MIRQLTLSLLLLSVLVAQGGSTVCQARCAEQQAASAVSHVASPTAGHCHSMRMATVSQQRLELQGVQLCSSHICAADLTAIGKKLSCDPGKLVFESSALPLSILVASLPARVTREANRPPRSTLHSSAADPLSNSLRV